MRILTARVVDGRLDVPEGVLHEGDTVTVLVPEADEQGFHLPAEAQRELRAAIEEAESGQAVDGWRLLEELKP